MQTNVIMNYTTVLFYQSKLGFFLNTCQIKTFSADDVIEADRFYQRALTHHPDDVRATSNRRRVATSVRQANKKIFDEIDEKLADLYGNKAFFVSINVVF